MYIHLYAATFVLRFQANFASLYAHCFLSLSIISLNLCTSLVSASYCIAASPQLHNPCSNWTLHSAWEHSAWLWRVISGPIALGYTLQNVLLCPFSHKGNRTHNPCNASVLLLGMELANLGSALSLLWTECHLPLASRSHTNTHLPHTHIRSHFWQNEKRTNADAQTRATLKTNNAVVFCCLRNLALTATQLEHLQSTTWNHSNTVFI